MEAARVVVTAEFFSQDNESLIQLYKAVVHNAASSPVRELSYYVDYGVLKSRRRVHRDSGHVVLADMGTLAPETKREGWLTVDGQADPELMVHELNSGLRWWFRDVHGDVWLHEKGGLRKLPSGKEYEGLFKV